MWEKIERFINKYALISAFLLTVLFFVLLGLIDFSTGDMASINLPVYAVIFSIGQLFLSVLILWVMWKISVFSKNDFKLKHIGKGLLLAWYGIIYAIIIFLMSFLQLPTNSLIVPNIFHLFAFVLATLCTGIFEEVLVRGLALKIILRKIGNSKKGIIVACICSSAYFGIAHIANLRSVGAILPVVVQIISATAIGLFFSALYLRSRTLWVPILIHSLINLSSFIFNAIVSSDVLQLVNQTEDEVNIIGSIIGAVLIATPFIISGLILLRKVKPEEIIEIYNN